MILNERHRSASLLPPQGKQAPTLPAFLFQLSSLPLKSHGTAWFALLDPQNLEKTHQVWRSPWARMGNERFTPEQFPGVEPAPAIITGRMYHDLHLQMRKLRFWRHEVNCQGSTANKGRVRIRNQVCPTPKPRRWSTSSCDAPARKETSPGVDEIAKPSAS